MLTTTILKTIVAINEFNRVVAIFMRALTDNFGQASGLATSQFNTRLTGKKDIHEEYANQDCLAKA